MNEITQISCRFTVNSLRQAGAWLMYKHLSFLLKSVQLSSKGRNGMSRKIQEIRTIPKNGSVYHSQGQYFSSYIFFQRVIKDLYKTLNWPVELYFSSQVFSSDVKDKSRKLNSCFHRSPEELCFYLFCGIISLHWLNFEHLLSNLVIGTSGNKSETVFLMVDLYFNTCQCNIKR